MGGLPRCSVCGWAYAKSGLGGVCTPCYNKRYESGERSQYDPFDGFATDREFFPKTFGIIKDKFGYEK